MVGGVQAHEASSSLSHTPSLNVRGCYRVNTQRVAHSFIPSFVNLFTHSFNYCRERVEEEEEALLPAAAAHTAAAVTAAGATPTKGPAASGGAAPSGSMRTGMAAGARSSRPAASAGAQCAVVG
jgi:hypothetical protein